MTQIQRWLGHQTTQCWQKSAFVQVMACRRRCDKLLVDPTLTGEIYGTIWRHWATKLQISSNHGIRFNEMSTTSSLEKSPILIWWRMHHSGVIMGAMASQITSLTIVYSPFIQAQIKENIKAPRHWPLCRKFTGDRWIPRTNDSNAENVSIWWRHHA